jgi:hypothetical protein
MLRDPTTPDSTQNVMPQKQEKPSAIPQPFQTRPQGRAGIFNELSIERVKT